MTSEQRALFQQAVFRSAPLPADWPADFAIITAYDPDGLPTTPELNRAADKVEGLMTSLQGFLGSDDGKEAAKSFADTAQSIRTLAENLDKRTAEMATNFNRVAGTGTRDLDVLTAEARRTLSEINRTLSDFNRNPQQILFGSRPSLPEYNRSR